MMDVKIKCLNWCMIIDEVIRIGALISCSFSGMSVAIYIWYVFMFICFILAQIGQANPFMYCS